MNQMKKRLISILLLLFFFVSDACATGFTQNSDQIEEAAKSVLKLFVYEKENAADDEYAATASGFVAFSGTMLITNYHVIDGAVEIWAVDDLDNVYQLKYVLAADEKSDIAILEFLKPTGLQPLVLYPDGNLKRGNQVAAIGSPKGLKNTVSTGIVSSVFEEDGIPYIQTTAPISPGSSGGALFNDDGKVIGVTTSAYTSKDEFGEDTEAQNINFAVNIAVAQAMYKAIPTVLNKIELKRSARYSFTSSRERLRRCCSWPPLSRTCLIPREAASSSRLPNSEITVATASFSVLPSRLSSVYLSSII